MGASVLAISHLFQDQFLCFSGLPCCCLKRYHTATWSPGDFGNEKWGIPALLSWDGVVIGLCWHCSVNVPHHEDPAEEWLPLFAATKSSRGLQPLEIRSKGLEFSFPSVWDHNHCIGTVFVRVGVAVMDVDLGP